MDLFSVRTSKKTSEAGVWIPDEEAKECNLCRTKFHLLNRRHHCRKCGGVVCGKCSDNRMFLESSRTGALKRVCDTCFAESRKSDTSEEEVEEDKGTKAATQAMGKLNVGGSSSSTKGGSSSSGSRPSGGGAGAGGGGGGGGSAAAPTSSAAAAAAAGKVNKSVVMTPKVPEISVEESVESIKAHPFDGKWKLILTFLVVEMGTAAKAEVPGLDVGSFKATGAGGGSGSKKSTLTKDGLVKTGSRVEVWLHLQPKGAAYFQGSCASFGQFGKEGKVTGALQRSVGKINMTVQMVNNRVTTAFNFAGMMDKSGMFQGTFSGCEISKNAGSVSGIFKAFRDDAGDEEGDGEEGARDAGAEEDGAGGRGSSDEDSKPKKTLSKKGSSSAIGAGGGGSKSSSGGGGGGGKAGGGGSKKKASSDSDE